MTTWSKDELHKIAQADDLHISPFRDDGVTYGTPTWIWSVAVDDALYVRGYNGQNSRWYQAAVRQKAGRIIDYRRLEGRVYLLYVRVPLQQEKARHFGRARIFLRLKLRVLGFRSGWLVAGCPAQDPAAEGAEVFLIPKGFASADLNLFDRRCSNDSGVALEVALRFAESYRHNGMLSLDIQEFGAQGNNRVLLLF